MNCLRKSNRPMPTDAKSEEGRPQAGPPRSTLRGGLRPTSGPRFWAVGRSSRRDGLRMRFRPDGLTCTGAPTGANVVRQREPWADPMDTNRLLIIAAAIVFALVLVWYLLPRSTPTSPTATPPPATTPAQPQQ
jgi:hypothetical protein